MRARDCRYRREPRPHPHGDPWSGGPRPPDRAAAPDGAWHGWRPHHLVVPARPDLIGNVAGAARMGRLSPLEVPSQVSNQPGPFVASLAGLDKRPTMQTWQLMSLPSAGREVQHQDQNKDQRPQISPDIRVTPKCGNRTQHDAGRRNKSAWHAEGQGVRWTSDEAAHWPFPRTARGLTLADGSV